MIACLGSQSTYVGRTCNLVERKACHLSSLRYSNHSNAGIQREYDLYGEESIAFIELCECTERSAPFLEQFYLDVLRSDLNIIRDVITTSTSRPRRKNSRTYQTISCHSCGKIFRNGRPDVLRKYCSTKCHVGSLRHQRVVVKCYNCGGNYTIRKNELAKRKFCSHPCSVIFRKVKHASQA